MRASATSEERYEVLDRYFAFNSRRKGRLRGPVERALKLVLATIVGLVLGVLRRRHAPRGAHCDVLVLHRWAGGERSVHDLSCALEARGLRVHHLRVAGRVERLRRWLFWPAAHAVPLRWRLDAWYAAYLVEAYRPSVVVIRDNYSVFVSALRMACVGRAWTVNVGHSVTPLHDNAAMFDVDFSLVFGQSSLAHCRKRQLRIGSTRVVEAGFLSIRHDFVLPPSADRHTLLFFSQLSAQLLRVPSFPQVLKERLARNTRLMLEFARQHSEYTVLVRRHPLEERGAMERMAGPLANLQVLPDELPMRDAVERASAVIVMWSNAALEAAVLGRPVIVLDDSDEPDDYLELDRFFGPRARSVPQLAERVREVYRDYEAHRAQCLQFVRYHLAHVVDSVPHVAGIIAGLAKGESEPAGVDLPERLDILETVN